MPNITRVIAMHNHSAEANADKVWAGLVLRLDNGQYQFVSLYGRRLSTINRSLQLPTSSYNANTKLERMERDKLAHGYTRIDWTEPRYGLTHAINREGTLAGPVGEAGVLARRQREHETRQRSHVTVRPTTPAVEAALRGEVLPAVEPSVEALSKYIEDKTVPPESESEKAAPAPEKRWIRQARKKF